MKRVLTIIVLCVSIISFASAAFANAVLIDAQGDVKVTVGGKTTQAKSGTELPMGSVVDVKSGSASVLIESGAVEEISAGKKYTVGQKSSSGKRTDLGSGIALAMKELAASGEGPTVHGMVKEAKGPQNIQLRAQPGKSGLRGTYPVGTAIKLGGDMRFAWSMPVKFSSPVLVIDDAKRKRIAQSNLTAGSVDFSRGSSKLHLKKGESYSWFLAEKTGNAVKGKTARFKFSTLSQSDEAQLDSEMSKINNIKMSGDGKRLLTAQVYFQHGLYEDMVKELKPIQGSTFAKKLLKLGYSKMGNMTEADKYR